MQRIAWQHLWKAAATPCSPRLYQVANAPVTHLIGIEIGGTKIQMVLADESLRIQRRWRWRVDGDRGAKGIRLEPEQAIHELRRKHELSAVGITRNERGFPLTQKTPARAAR